MKKINTDTARGLLIACALSSPLVGQAQEVSAPIQEPALTAARAPENAAGPKPAAADSMPAWQLTAADSIRLTRPAPLYGYGYRGYDYGYRGLLHEGLNVSLGMSVFAEFGKHARSGAGFTQSLNATYLHPLGKKAWLAVGGYVDHTLWGGDHYTSGGLYGELGYQFDKHWAAYIYGQKSIVNSGVKAMYSPYLFGRYGMYTPYALEGLADKLGAAVRWTPNPTLSVELSVEKNWYPSSSLSYPDQYKYNYPTPKP